MSEPKDDDCAPDEIRDARVIAIRALTLFGVVRLALGRPRDEVTLWLQKEQLWKELTPTELSYVSAQHPTERQGINASWRSEALLVLLWALGQVETLPPPNEQCDTALFKKILPPYVEMSTAEYLRAAKRRSDDSLLDMAAEQLDLHWQARDAKINLKPASHLDIEIIQERHHAINWVVGYRGLPWDEITTDT